MEWCNKIGHRERKAWLLLVHQGKVYEFKGKSIPGVCVVIGRDYSKAGKWSCSTFTLELASGVKAFPGHDGWEMGTFIEGLASATKCKILRWTDMANALGVTVGEARRFCEESRPPTAEEFDRIETELAALDDAETDSGIVEKAYNFNSPTNRAIAAGFWKWPVVVFLDGEIGRVIPSPGWGTPIAQGRVKILRCEKASGYHGGSVGLILAIPQGATLHHGEPKPEQPQPEPEPEPEPEPTKPEPIRLGLMADAFAALQK